VAAGALRGLQRIQLWSLFGARGLYNVGSHIAVPDAPLGSGLREHQAVCTGRELLGFLTAGAFFSDRMAASAVKLAAALTHKKTINTLFDACTNHGYHIPSLGFGNF
jgi:hypothetical protein